MAQFIHNFDQLTARLEALKQQIADQAESLLEDEELAEQDAA